MNNINYKDMTIGDRLKYVRVELLKISLETFSTRLGMKSRSSMSRYERSGFQFSDRIIKQICTEFLINENWLREGEGEIFQSCVDDLKDICKKYNIDSNSEHLIRTFIGLEQNERESISKFLIDLGTNFKKSNDTLNIENFKQRKAPVLSIYEDNNSDDVETIEIPLYATSASAGIGKYLGDNDPFELIKFPLNRITKKADFAVKVCGDSMEHIIADGQTIFIKSMPMVEQNQIGLFLYNEEVYCKRLVLDEQNRSIILRSENEIYNDIIVDDSSQLTTLGLVLM